MRTSTREHILIESLYAAHIWRSFHGLIIVRTMEEFRNEKNGLGDAEKKEKLHGKS